MLFLEPLTWEEAKSEFYKKFPQHEVDRITSTGWIRIVTQRSTPISADDLTSIWERVSQELANYASARDNVIS